MNLLGNYKTKKKKFLPLKQAKDTKTTFFEIQTLSSLEMKKIKHPKMQKPEKIEPLRKGEDSRESIGPDTNTENNTQTNNQESKYFFFVIAEKKNFFSLCP